MAAEAMDDLADRMAPRGVTSAFLYTREAHPGENYGPHRTMEDKRGNARAFIKHSHVRRPVLLDDLEGPAHHAYGLLPNMTWIVGRGGVILYKADWTDARDVEDALNSALEHLERRAKDNLRPLYSERVGWRGTDHEAFPRRSGTRRAPGRTRLLRRQSQVNGPSSGSASSRCPT